MGEPIRLWRDGEERTVYGRAMMEALIVEGWTTEAPRPELPVMSFVAPPAGGIPQPVGAEAPQAPAPAKPAKRRGGEYGAGAGTQRVVDAEKIAEAGAERKAEGRGR